MCYRRERNEEKKYNIDYTQQNKVVTVFSAASDILHSSLIHFTEWPIIDNRLLFMVTLLGLEKVFHHTLKFQHVTSKI